MKICAIILSQNNANTIGDLIARCRNVLEPDVFVLDDDSSDDTLIVARNAGAAILYPEPQQNESPTMAGLRNAYELEYTHGIVIRASAPHVPEVIPSLVDAAWNFPSRIFLGVAKGQRRRFAATNFWANLAALTLFEDAASPIRLYPLEGILSLPCKESGPHFDTEALVRASWAGIETDHVEVTTFQAELPHRPGANIFGMKLFLQMLIRSPKIILKRLRTI